MVHGKTKYKGAKDIGKRADVGSMMGIALKLSSFGLVSTTCRINKRGSFCG
jgi:hypothetical protein